MRKIMRNTLFLILAVLVLATICYCAKKKNPAKWDNPQDDTGENWHPPTVVMMEGGAVPYCDTLFVTATASDSNGTILDYCWDTNGAGYFDTTLSGTLDVYLPDTGWYTIRVKARDNDKLCSQPDSVRLYATFHPPVVVGVPDFAVSIYDTFTLTATGADSNGVITKYLWALDGVNYTEETMAGSLRIVFGSEGVKTIKVRAVDDDNLQSLPDEIRVTVRLDAPEVTAMDDITVSIFDTIGITATASDPNGNIVSYHWAFDGLHFVDSTDTGFVEHVFDSAGTYDVRVKVKDNDGIFSTDDAVRIFVRADAPTVTVMADTAASIYDTLVLTASASDSNGNVVSYHWAFDGINFVDSTDTGFVKHVFNDAGEYGVKIKVKDDDGVFSPEYTVRITVNLDAPSVVAMDDFTVSIYDTLALTAVGDDTNGEIVRYLWALDGMNYWDTTATGTLETVFDMDGMRTVRVIAVDDDGIVSVPGDVIVTVVLNAPTVVMSDTVLTLAVDETLRATASDPNGSVEKYYWALDGVTYADSTDSSRIVTRFSGEGRYTVKVKVRDDDGIFSDEAEAAYTVKTTSPVPVYPEDGSEYQYASTVEFRWSPGSYRERYMVLMDESDPPATVIVDSLLDSSYAANGIAPGKKYYWRVTAFNHRGEAVQGPVWSISIGADTLIDERDGKRYPIRIFGNQVWMLENLNIGTMISGGSKPYDNGVIEKYAYENTAGNADSLGGLYQWDEAMGYDASERVQGICPDGWHIPSDGEWKELEVYLGMDETDVNSSGYRGTTQGASLKDGAFNALLAGYLYAGTFAFKGVNVGYWSSSGKDGDFAWFRHLNVDLDNVYRYFTDRTNGYCVRCIKD